MWCATCQATVGQPTDNEATACPRCGTALTVPPSATDQARDLLQHWAKDNPLEMPTPATPTNPEPVVESSKQPKRHFRVDAAHPQHQSKQQDKPKTEKPAKAITPPVTKPAPQQPLANQPVAPKPPHTKSPAVQKDSLSDVASTLANFSIDAQPAAPPTAPEPEVAVSSTTDTVPDETAENQPSIPTGGTTSAVTHSTSLWGQILAYIGVLGLTAGGALIVWNGFGHAPLNTPTSWLIATGGQMLLFLGIVTLVSSGLEQTNEDVNRQVRLLGEQLQRIEQGQTTSADPAPHHASPRTTSKTPHHAQPSGTGATKPK
ncbi:MAG: hypothetical protein VX311_01535 [Planctomycetota bacterium]|nr:hypothetical protein [Planctomycetota bacterium]